MKQVAAASISRRRVSPPLSVTACAFMQRILQTDRSVCQMEPPSSALGRAVLATLGAGIPLQLALDLRDHRAAADAVARRDAEHEHRNAHGSHEGDLKTAHVAAFAGERSNPAIGLPGP